MKKAREKLPKIEVESPKEARKELPKKQRWNWPTFWFVVFIVAWVFVSVVVAQILVGNLMVWTLGAERVVQPVWSGIYSVLSYGLALASIMFVPPLLARSWKVSTTINHKRVVWKGDGKSLEPRRKELGLTGSPTWTDIGLAPIGYIVATLMAAALVWVFNLFPWFNASEAQQTGFNYYIFGVDRVIAFVVLVILAPIVEEVIFRGWLYGKLRARLSAPLSILIVSALFGLIHFQWNVGVNVFALSVVLCVMREITGTIYAGILTHMIKNGVAFYLLYVMMIG
ncbi:CPBP family intramembrane metalloprotease [Candidatus Saccharibacteria bacterium]|nr:CPBP family intramembrane metalloprotease [Candidatus Saccharibacteria bacterium]